MVTTEDLSRRARALVSTSVDDCRTSLFFESNPDVVRAALSLAEERGHGSRVKLLRAKIRKEGW